ncbi:MAG: GNAT family N-acetyltransferase [Clostridiales bacterium]|nr:GNAT family N-acetyltransferase [Clostridiales bacterium]
MFNIREATDLDIIKELFREYSKIQGAEACFVSFENELADLEKVYQDGALLVAYEDTVPIGCGAIKKISDNECEMKRVFIKEEYRKKGYGYRLINEVCGKASALGYKTIVLSTIPTVMSQAYALYKLVGFTVKGSSDGIVSMIKDLP